jgi:hypothetical protein
MDMQLADCPCRSQRRQYAAGPALLLWRQGRPTAEHHPLGGLVFRPIRPAAALGGSECLGTLPETADALWAIVAKKNSRPTRTPSG